MLDHDTPASPTSALPESRHPLAHVLGWFRPRLVLGLVVGLLAVEGGIRLLEARTGNLLIADRGTAALHEQTLHAYPDAFDVVAIGSSSTGAAMWMPDIEGSGAVCDGYVSWLPSTNIDEMAAFTADEILPTQHPRQLLVGLTMREFVIPDDYVSAASTASDGTSAMRWAKKHLALLRGRKTLQAPDRVGAALRGVLLEQLTPDGNQLVMRDRLITSESERHLYQEQQRMAQFSIDPAVFGRLDAMIREIQDAGVTPVLVNLPVTDQFIGLTPHGRADYEAYRDAITTSASSAGVQLIDLGDPAAIGLDQSTDFADVNHLNAQGATKFTEALSPQLGRCAG